MATYTMKMPYGEYPGQYLPNHWAYDYNPSLDELLDYGSYTARTTTKAVYQMDNGIDLVITGTGFTYNSTNKTLNGGTISGLSLLDHNGGAVMQTVTGLKWSGASFYDTVTVGSSWHTADVILKGNDTLKGSSGSDEIWGHAGNDKLFGGDGGDNLVGGRGADTYDGGTTSGGVDQLDYEDAYFDTSGASGVFVDMEKGTATDPWGFAETFTNIQRIKGTQFADKMYGSAAADQFRSLGGNDSIDGRGGSDTVRYDRDTQHGGNKGVVVDLKAGTGIDGFGAKDTLKNIENVRGSIFSDKLTGSNVANLLDGLEGNDTLTGGAGADSLSGGSGSDTASYAGAAKGIVADLTSPSKNTNDAKGDTYYSIENLTGSSYSDTLVGSSTSNKISGGAGNDKLTGGLGKDVLTGGSGNDVFIFNSKLGTNHIDTIDDFAHAADVIWLDDDIFTTAGAVGDLASGAFYVGAAAHDKSDRVIYDKSTGKLWYDDDGTGSHAAVQFGLVDKGLTLTAADFDIIA